jgi:SEC-C motif-containing protein
MKSCPCGSGNEYSHCCFLFISGQKLPTTPEELMRSRYTAYTQANIDYIRLTMQGPAAKNFDPIDAHKWATEVKWDKLNVLASQTKGRQGFVEFIAYYSDLDEAQTLHEVSEFHFEQGKWFYVSGKQATPTFTPKIKLSRNASCSCGSNKKYKKCCGL